MENENRTVESANETKEEVMANLGLSSDVVKEQKSDSASKAADENIEESETSNTDEEQEEVTEDESNKDEAKGKKQGGFQKKINKLTGRATAAEQRAAFLESELLKLKGSPLEKPVVEQASSSKPDPASFESHADYIEALTDWKLEDREKKAEEKKQQETAKSEAQVKAQTFQSKVEEFVKSKPDYHEVLNNCDVEVKQGLIDLIKESDIAPLLGYELANNEEELERINALPPRQAAIELLKFEAKLHSSSEQKPKEIKTTSASRPLKPVGSASKANISDSPYEKEMSYQEYKAWSAKQKK